MVKSSREVFIIDGKTTEGKAKEITIFIDNRDKQTKIVFEKDGEKTTFTVIKTLNGIDEGKAYKSYYVESNYADVQSFTVFDDVVYMYFTHDDFIIYYPVSFLLSD